MGRRQIPEIRAPPCFDRGADRTDVGRASEVIQSFCMDRFHALLGQSTVHEGWPKVSLVGCHVNSSDSPFLDETIEAKTAGREPWKDFLPFAIHNTVSFVCKQQTVASSNACLLGNKI